MNNISVGLKKIIMNKNVVTIILVIAALGLLFWGYSYTIKKETNPIQVPVAAHKINPKTRITNEDIGYATVPGKLVDSTVERNSGNILNKYTNINVTIPQGSMFYSEWLVTGDKLPGNWIEQVDFKKGELAYYMDVNIESTLGNNVIPDSYIDIFMEAEDENGTLMIGKLLGGIKILVVHDSSGNNVFDDETARIPAKIGFAVNQEIYLLLQKIDYLRLDLIIAPKGSAVPASKGVVVKSSTLKDFVDSQTLTIEEDEVEEVKETTETTDKNS